MSDYVTLEVKTEVRNIHIAMRVGSFPLALRHEFISPKNYPRMPPGNLMNHQKKNIKSENIVTIVGNNGGILRVMKRMERQQRSQM